MTKNIFININGEQTVYRTLITLTGKHPNCQMTDMTHDASL